MDFKVERRQTEGRGTWPALLLLLQLMAQAQCATLRKYYGMHKHKLKDARVLKNKRFIHNPHMLQWDFSVSTFTSIDSSQIYLYFIISITIEMNAMLKYLNSVVNVTLIDSFTTIDI